MTFGIVMFYVLMASYFILMAELAAIMGLIARKRFPARPKIYYVLIWFVFIICGCGAVAGWADRMLAFYVSPIVLISCMFVLRSLGFLFKMTHPIEDERKRRELEVLTHENRNKVLFIATLFFFFLAFRNEVELLNKKPLEFKDYKVSRTNDGIYIFTPVHGRETRHK